MARRLLLEDQIRHNRAATTRLFVLLFVILFALVFAISYAFIGNLPLTAGFALVFGLVYLALASGNGVPAILRAAQAKPADPTVREQRLLLHRVEEMAIASGLPMPKVYVQESNDINAFAAGRDPKEAVICVTTGALQLLDQEELQGVIGHEMSHIRNYDVRVATYAIALIGITAMIAETVFRVAWMGGGRRGRDSGGALMILLAFAFAILAPLLSRLTYLAISRRREYLADASGAELTRNPEGLARALEKIAADPKLEPVGSRTVASLYLSNPWVRLKRESLWSTHPPLEERVRRLRQM